MSLLPNLEKNFLEHVFGFRAFVRTRPLELLTRKGNSFAPAFASAARPAALVVFDVTLTLWAGAFPSLWFRVFHGAPYDDPQGFLRRCASQREIQHIETELVFRAFRRIFLRIDSRYSS